MKPHIQYKRSYSLFFLRFKKKWELIYFSTTRDHCEHFMDSSSIWVNIGLGMEPGEEESGQRISGTTFCA